MNERTRVVLRGSPGHATAYLEAMEFTGRFEVVACTDDVVPARVVSRSSGSRRSVE